MKTPYNRFAIIPFHCVYCHNYIWLEKYRKADVWLDYANRFMKQKICKGCLKKFTDVEKQGEENT